MLSYLRFARVFCPLMLLTASAWAADPTAVPLADGKFEVQAPATWTQKKPANAIIEHEFAIPKAEGDQNDGRLTIMAAGGSVDANVERWYAQFPGSKRDPANTKKLSVAGLDVYLVDISGTFADRPSPMAPAVQRPNYRMLGAIIETKGSGTYFLKFYGPERTVADNAKAFNSMVESLKKK